jgi:hypothetical protein
MNIPRNLKLVFAATLLAGGGVAAALGPAALTAQAAPGCPRLQACTQWCPGQPNPAGRPVPWDTGVCHDYYWDSYGVHDVDNGAFYAWSKMGW